MINDHSTTFLNISKISKFQKNSKNINFYLSQKRFEIEGNGQHLRITCIVNYHSTTFLNILKLQILKTECVVFVHRHKARLVKAKYNSQSPVKYCFCAITSLFMGRHTRSVLYKYIHVYVTFEKLVIVN